MSKIAPVWEGTSLEEALRRVKRGDTIVIVPHFEVWETPDLVELDGGADEEAADTARAVAMGYVAAWIGRAKAPLAERVRKLLPRRRLPADVRAHLDPPL